MELTAKLIEEAEFRQSFRGYDVDQVDDFLEEVAKGVDALIKQVSSLSNGAPAAAVPAPSPLVVPDAKPAPVEVPAPPVAARPTGPDPKALEDNTDELRRTLILAQRTADAAIREAKEEAARLVAEARDSSSRQIAEADAKAKKLIADAEAKAATIVAEAERMADEHRASNHDRLKGEIDALEGTREQLRGDATVIDRHVEEQRQQLRSAVGELQRLIDDPKGFRLNPPPPARTITSPELADPEPIGPPPTAESIAPRVVATPEIVPEPTPEPAPEPASVAPEPVAVEPVVVEVPEPPVAKAPAPVEAPVAAAPAVEAEPEPEPQAQAELAWDAAEPEPVQDPEAEVDAWSSLRDEPVVDLTIPDPGGIESPEDDDEPEVEAADALDDLSGEPTQAVPQLKGDADEDAFLAELRKAMTDEEPLGPRDDTTIPTRSTVDPLADNQRSRPRFGRRR